MVDGADMKFSMFSVQDHHPDLPRSLTGFYDEMREQVMLAEQLGFYAFFVAEHHFHEYGVYPNPAVALAQMAAVTEKIRLGPAVTILPFRNPITVAEDYAMLDQISHGRVELGVGSGYLAHEFAGFDADPKNKRFQFDEALTVLKKALSGERFSHKGEYYQVDDIQLNVTPLQKPFPPIYVAVLRREAAYHVGKQGNKLMTVPYAACDTFEEIGPMMAEYIKGYGESAAAAGDRATITSLHTYVADSDEQAREEAAAAFDLYVETRLYAKSQVYDDIIKSGLALFGGIDTVVDKLVRLHAVGVDHVAFLVNFGGLEDALVRACMERIAKKVIPAVKARIAAGVAAA
ncbi:MAG TPA: LLM class flavin-dependent oxidoreductase [Alphaproteobacteria bacterium]|nr:LLM class flavin-dependent oxidoreductase [Alphaproteobacteria bacterium]